MRAIFIPTCLCGMHNRKANYNLGKQVNDNYRKAGNTQSSKSNLYNRKKDNYSTDQV